MILSPQQVKGALFMYCAQISAENMQFRQSYGLKSKIFKSCGRVLARTFVGHAFLWKGWDGARPGTLFILIGSSQNFTERCNRTFLIDC